MQFPFNNGYNPYLQAHKGGQKTFKSARDREDNNKGA
jgi:hypothetical protein